MARWSVPLVEIEPALLELVLDSITRRRDGLAVTASVARRRKNTMGQVLRAAHRRDHLRDNPMARIEWRSPSMDPTVDISTVASYADVLEISDLVSGTKGGARYSALSQQ